MQYRALVFMIATALALGACDKHMANQPKDKTWHAAEKLPNGLTWPLSPPDGMVSRDPPKAPPPLSLALLERGHERYDIYCAACHAMTGEGNGMVVQRGFPMPPALDSPRIVAESSQHYYNVITDGFGVMYSFAERIAPTDRWAIVAYLRALQRARHGTIADIPAAQRGALQ